MTIEVRLATINDVYAASKAYVSGFVYEYAPLDPINCWLPFMNSMRMENEMEKNILHNRHHNNPERRVHVITVKDTVVGVCNASKVSDEAFEINQVSLRPDVIGRGLGRMLIIEAAKNYQTLGFKRLETYGTITSQKAHKFFTEHLGGALEETFPYVWNPGDIDGAGGEIVAAKYSWDLDALVKRPYDQPKVWDVSERIVFPNYTNQVGKVEFGSPHYAYEPDDTGLAAPRDVSVEESFYADLGMIFQQACRELPANHAIARYLEVTTDGLYQMFKESSGMLEHMCVEMVPTEEMPCLVDIKTPEDLTKVDYRVTLG